MREGTSRTGKPIPFHSLLEMNGAVGCALSEHEIRLHIPRRIKKYVSK